MIRAGFIPNVSRCIPNSLAEFFYNLVITTLEREIMPVLGIDYGGSAGHILTERNGCLYLVVGVHDRLVAVRIMSLIGTAVLDDGLLTLTQNAGRLVL